MSAPAAPRMVGRETELETLLSAFAEGRRGHPRTVLLRGEAGIGKTRLVQAFLDRIAASNDTDGPSVVAVIGQCVDVGPIGAPFGPIRRVLRAIASSIGPDALADAAGSAAETLASAVPALQTSTPQDAADMGFADALEVALESLSTTHHLVIVLEDLQWADASTLALLKALAGTLTGHHLTIVATYRSDDVDRYHPLRPVLAEFARAREITRIDLAPLTADEVDDQIRLLATRHLLDDEVRALVVERSGGIPFLVEELVDLGDAALPDVLRDLVLARYLRLSPETQQVVRTMAAGGIHVDEDVLFRVASADETALDLALREAIDAHIVQADETGYRFRHALTQEAVNDELLPSERARAHRRYAELLSGDAADPDAIAAAAEHWLIARDIPRAFDTSVTALALARAAYAPATTARILERLTELWAEVPDAAERAGTTLAALHLDASFAWQAVGELDRALRVTNEGLEVADPAREPVVRAGLLRQKFVHQANIREEIDRALLTEAVALLEGIEDREAKVLQSRILTNVALEVVRQGPSGITDADREAVAAHLRRALALADETGDGAASATALVAEAARLIHVEEDEAAAIEPSVRMRQLALDPAYRAYMGVWDVEGLAQLGEYAASAEAGRAYLAEATAAGLERGDGAILAAVTAYADFCAGRPAEALASAHRATRLMDPSNRPLVLRTLGTHYTWNDEPALRDELLASEGPTLEAHRQARGGVLLWWTDAAVDGVLASVAGLGETFADDDLADRVAIITEAMTDAWMVTTRRYAAVTLALTAKAVLSGDLTCGAGDIDAAALCDRVRAAVEVWPDRGPAPAVAAFVRAALADAEGMPADDRAERWRAAAVAAEDGMPVRFGHLARLGWSAALLDAGERVGAGEVLARIVIEAPTHGVARIGRWAGVLAQRAGVGAGGDLAGGAEGAASASPLTSREQQVLDLLAEGLTNTQIGERLFISPKTVSVHVSAILSKTGTANRTEAAATLRGSGRTDDGAAPP